jgi:hypothetical protein
MDKTYMDVEDLEIYQRLCKLHIEVCDLSHEWPQEELLVSFDPEAFRPRAQGRGVLDRLNSEH